MRHKKAIIALLCFTVVGYNVSASESNAVMRKCLEESGYTPEKFDTFDFREAAICHSNYRIKQNAQKVKDLREFTKKRPWYKGPNWAWEDKVELACHKEVHTGVTFCHRPYELKP